MLRGYARSSCGSEQGPGTKEEFTSIGKETLWLWWRAAPRAFSLVAQSEGAPKAPVLVISDLAVLVRWDLLSWRRGLRFPPGLQGQRKEWVRPSHGEPPSLHHGSFPTGQSQQKKRCGEKGRRPISCWGLSVFSSKQEVSPRRG